MDSYISVIEAVKHAAYFFKRKPEIVWLSSEKYERNPLAVHELRKCDGIIVPGGFGDRGVKGKMKAIEYCRTNKIPFLGLCLGMQLAVVEFAQNVCGISGACSAEFTQKPKGHKAVIDVMPEQKALLKEKKYGGTMRLGAYECAVMPNTLSFKAYKDTGAVLDGECLIISERHRHRYELNNAFRDTLERNGMTMAGIHPERDLVEIVELKQHPFFVGTQFHPEFKSRPLKPHPIFKAFLKTCV